MQPRFADSRNTYCSYWRQHKTDWTWSPRTTVEGHNRHTRPRAWQLDTLREYGLCRNAKIKMGPILDSSLCCDTRNCRRPEWKLSSEVHYIRRNSFSVHLHVMPGLGLLSNPPPPHWHLPFVNLVSRHNSDDGHLHEEHMQWNAGSTDCETSGAIPVACSLGTFPLSRVLGGLEGHWSFSTLFFKMCQYRESWTTRFLQRKCWLTKIP
jgi:hypothetical protein